MEVVLTLSRLQNGPEASEGRFHIAWAPQNCRHKRYNASWQGLPLFRKRPPAVKFGALALMLLSCSSAHAFGARELVTGRSSGLHGDAQRAGILFVVRNEGGKPYRLGD